MAKDKSAEPYVFPGMTPFFTQVATDLGLDPHQLGRAVQGWHIAQLQQLLGQLPRLDPDNQQKMLDEHVYPILESLDGANEAAKAAVADAVAGCGIAAPKRLKPAEKEKKR
jgi:hypothetical protein